jgi:phospholipid/cholesterol/gamma-HCH transport system substrate-binding protein
MKITGTAIKLGAFATVLLFFTAAVIVVFGQFRFDRTNGYSAEFSNASGLRAGQFVRASGVEVGKVKDVRLIDGDKRVRVEFAVDRSLPLYQSTTAQIRYQNLIGDRYLELTRGEGQGADQKLPPGGFIPLSRTQPALDLDALIGGFKPLFRALDPEKVNTIASSILTVFQGQGGTINDILDQTAQLTSALAERDQAIGEVIKNLNSVLDTTVRHQQQFDQTVNNFEALITGLKNHGDSLAANVAHLSNAAGTVADLLADNRPLLHDTVQYLDVISQPLIDQQDRLNDIFQKVPQDFKLIGRAGGIYGDFFNLYLCELGVKVNGLQPGGPVRTVKLLWNQPTGRCTAQ